MDLEFTTTRAGKLSPTDFLLVANLPRLTNPTWVYQYRKLSSLNGTPLARELSSSLDSFPRPSQGSAAMSGPRLPKKIRFQHDKASLPASYGGRKWSRHCVALGKSKGEMHRIILTLRSLQIVWFTLEYPFYAYTVLQALYLLPPGFRPSLLSLIPFKDAALWTETPITWRNQTWSSLASFLLRDFRHPIVLAFLRDRLSNLLFPKLYVHLRELLVKPNRPDGMSLQGGSAQLHIVPGKITTGTARRLARGGGTVKGVLGRWLSNVLWFSLTVLHTQRVPMAIELSPEIEVALIELSVLRYHTLARHDRERGIIRSQRMLRVMAIRAAFREFNLDPDSSMVDIFELADELANEMSMYGSSRASTSTPEPQDLPPLDELLANTGDGNENEVDVEIQVEVVIAADEGDGDARSAIRRLQRSTTTTEPDLARDIHLGGTTEFVPATEESNEVHALPGYVSIEPPPEPPEPATERSPGPREASPPRTSDSMGVPIGEEQAREAFNTRAMPLPPVRAGPEPLHYISYEYGPQVAITLHGIGEGRRTIGAVTEPAFQPTVPLDTLLEPTPSGFEDPILPEPGSPGRLSRVESLPSEVRARHGRRFATSHGLTPSPPVPGITRAASLSHAPLRPLRRPTISDQQVPTFRQREAARRQAAGPRDSANTNTNSKSGTYRVTMLSNHAAEALAYHATSLLESIILLPLDVMFTRSLARNFLARHQHHPLVPQLTTPSLSMSGIWPLGLRAQMRELTAPQEMRFWGNFLVTIGVQGLINLGIWAAGVGFTLSLGESFGWGKM